MRKNSWRAASGALAVLVGLPALMDEAVAAKVVAQPTAHATSHAKTRFASQTKRAEAVSSKARTQPTESALHALEPDPTGCFATLPAWSRPPAELATQGDIFGDGKITPSREEFLPSKHSATDDIMVGDTNHDGVLDVEDSQGMSQQWLSLMHESSEMLP